MTDQERIEKLRVAGWVVERPAETEEEMAQKLRESGWIVKKSYTKSLAWAEAIRRRTGKVPRGFKYPEAANGQTEKPADN